MSQIPAPAPLPRPHEGASEDIWLAYLRGLSGRELGPLIDGLHQALAAYPGSPRLRYNLGVALARAGDQAGAARCWRALLDSDTHGARARQSLVVQALDMLDAPGALAHAQALVALPDATPMAWCLLGKACVLSGSWDEAKSSFEAALQRCELAPTPEDIQADVRRGLRLSTVLCWRAGDSPAPPADWADLDHASFRLVQPSPWDALPHTMDNELTALSVLIDLGMPRIKACDWRERPTVIKAMKRVAQRVMAHPEQALTRSMAWEALHLGLSPQELQAIARGSAQRARHTQQAHPWRPRLKAASDVEQTRAQAARPSSGRIKLAYLSYNYGRHPTMQLAHRLLAHHDRQRFEVWAYALNAPDGSPQRQQAINAVDHFVEAHHLSPREVAQQMLDDGVDVLIGLGGHSEGPVLDVALWRPAMVQINYLAFCGTVGCPEAFDIHISDTLTVPPDMAPWYDEEVAYLPHGHYAYDDTRTLGPAPSRESQGLPPDALVLCGFNNSYKLEPRTIGAWCDVMRALPQSVLWVYTVHPEQAGHLSAALQTRGISPSRLVCSPTLEGLAHLQRLQCADLFLDSLDYNGHTTLLDALYAGVPAVSCMGGTAASRIGGAILSEVGLHDWVSHSVPEMVQAAVALARSPQQRAQIRKHLLTTARQGTPFHSATRCQQLEALYERLLARAQSPSGTEDASMIRHAS